MANTAVTGTVTAITDYTFKGREGHIVTLTDASGQAVEVIVLMVNPLATEAPIPAIGQTATAEGSLRPSDGRIAAKGSLDEATNVMTYLTVA